MPKENESLVWTELKPGGLVLESIAGLFFIPELLATGNLIFAIPLAILLADAAHNGILLSSLIDRFDPESNLIIHKERTDFSEFHH